MSANTDNGSCTYAPSNADCSGNCLNGYTLINGECVETLMGCTNITAWNYDSLANVDDGSCDTATNGILDNNEVDTSNGYTYVPDDSFEKRLINLGYDNVLDNYVLTDEIINVTSLEVDNFSVNSQKIQDLTGIEDFAALQYLECGMNEITSLDLSQNITLSSVNCADNQLTSLDLRNGNNTNFTSFDCRYNDSLYCISVDDSIWAISNWSLIPNYSFFSNNCNNVPDGFTSIPDSIFEDRLINLGYDNVHDGEVLEIW